MKFHPQLPHMVSPAVKDPRAKPSGTQTDKKHECLGRVPPRTCPSLTEMGTMDEVKEHCYKSINLDSQLSDAYILICRCSEE